MTYVTYPLIKETKLLLNIINNLNLALLNCMYAFLLYERYYKRTMGIPDNLKGKLDLLLHLGIRYGIKREDIDLIKGINEIVEAHKKSPIEFTRKEKFVIFNNSYSSYKSVDIDSVKKYISKAKVFISRVGSILING